MKESNIKIHPVDTPIGKEFGQLSLDIFQTDKEIVILAPIAGVRESDITLSITDDVLVIRGTRQQRFEIAEENYYTRECFWGDFSRSIVLPLEADTKGISAKFDDNVLEIHIPKGEIQKTQVIKIKSSNE